MDEPRLQDRYFARVDQVISCLVVVLAFLLPLYRRGVSVIAPLIVVLWLLGGPWRRRWSGIRSSGTIIAALLFVLLNLVSLLWSSHLTEAWDYVAKYRYLLLVPVIATSLRPGFVRPVVAAFLAGIGITVVWSYALFLGLLHFGRNFPEHPAPTMSHLDYSMLLAVASLLVLHLALRRPLPLGRRLLWLALFAATTGCLFINIGRSGQLAFFGALLLVLPRYLKLRPLPCILVSTTAVILAALLIYSTVPVFRERAREAGREIRAALVEHDYDSNQGKRIAGMIVAAEIIREHPVFGAGTGDNMIEFQWLLKRHYPSLQQIIFRFQHMHNQYLQTATELGLVGLLSLLAIFVQLLRARPQRYLLQGLAVILGWVFLFGFFGDPFFHKQLPLTLFALMAGLVCTEKSNLWQQQPETPAPVQAAEPSSSSA